MRIDSKYFPNTLGNAFWTASAGADVSGGSWIVYFGDGFVSASRRDYHYAVRLVRGGQYLLPFSFTDNNDGTVQDNNTGLLWAKCSVGRSGSDCATGSTSTMTWGNALNAAKHSRLAGRSDWRLPNVKELQSLVDYSRYDPSINDSYFPYMSVVYFGSSSALAGALAGDSRHSWLVYFGNGGVDVHRNDYYAVRLVCGGQSFAFFNLTVAKTGNGTGTVVSNPVGINCGAGCAANFTTNSNVILTAIPTAGSTFGGWSGAGCSGTSTCTVTMSADQAVTATFTLTPVILAPTVSTNATSVITANSARINGTVNDNGAATTVSFNYGLTSGYGTNLAATPGSISAGSGATSVVATLYGLNCNTTYHYQMKAVNSAGTTLGQDKSFTTSVCAVSSPGDANGDSKINSLDLVAVVNQILGIATAKGDPDCNGDNKVNSLDVICIANKILGL